MLGPADRRPLLFSTPDLPDQPSPSLRGLVGVEPSASSVDLHVVPRKILDTVGHERPRLVSVDEIKVRFFSLGLQTGFGLQMFLMSAVLMAAAQRQGGPMYEFALGYYPLFRGLFLICFFCSCYGIVLFLWKRHDVDYRSVLGVPQQHNYHSIVTLSFLAMSFVFGCFALYVLSLTDHLTPYKHAWPAIAAGTSLLFLLFPFDWMPEWRDARQRAALCRSLARGTFLSPFLLPELSDTILTDVRSARRHGSASTCELRPLTRLRAVIRSSAPCRSSSSTCCAPAALRHRRSRPSVCPRHVHDACHRLPLCHRRGVRDRVRRRESARRRHVRHVHKRGVEALLCVQGGAYLHTHTHTHARAHTHTPHPRAPGLALSVPRGSCLGRVWRSVPAFPAGAPLARPLRLPARAVPAPARPGRQAAREHVGLSAAGAGASRETARE